MISKKKISFLVILSSFLLAACDSDSGSSSGKDVSEPDLSVETFGDLPDCADEHEGASAYVKEKKATYICVEGDWTSDSASKSGNGKNGAKSSSSGKTRSLSSAAIPDVDLESSSSAKSSSSVESSSSVLKRVQCNVKTDKNCFRDDRDGQTYKMVTIGSQTWMAENLDYADSIATPSLKGKNWCKKDNCAVEGRFYDWAAAIDSIALYDGGNGIECGRKKLCTLVMVQGICPKGWHLPTNDEWNTLFDEVVGHSAEENIFNFNDHRVNYGAVFWSASEYDEYIAYAAYLSYEYDDSDFYESYNKYDGLNIRCLKD